MIQVGQKYSLGFQLAHRIEATERAIHITPEELKGTLMDLESIRFFVAETMPNATQREDCLMRS